MPFIVLIFTTLQLLNFHNVVTVFVVKQCTEYMQ